MAPLQRTRPARHSAARERAVRRQAVPIWALTAALTLAAAGHPGATGAETGRRVPDTAVAGPTIPGAALTHIAGNRRIGASVIGERARISRSGRSSW
jgi:hypothetical protein